MSISMRSLVQVVCVVAVLAAIAIPLSSLMVAETTASPSPVLMPMEEVQTIQSTEASSAVSALMAGSAVGPSRGARLMPRHPASAFVP